MRFCCVPGCNKEQYPGCGLSFHRMPVEEWMQQNWLKVIPGKVTKSSHVCSLHFKTDDFIKNRKHVLKWNAIPSIFKKKPNLSRLPVSRCKEKKDFFPSEKSAVSDEEIFLPEYLNSDEEPDQLQEGYYCNRCCQVIHGYRYICVECDDFDLCTECETKGEHPEHFMLRVPESKSHDEIIIVLERIRKELLEDKTKIDDSSKNESKEDPLAEMRCDKKVPGHSDMQLMCIETDYLEENEANSNLNEFQKRECPEKDLYVPSKRQKHNKESAQNSSTTINPEEKKSKDAEYKAFLYRKITVLPPFTDDSERKIVTVTSPFITKITSVNPEKETNMTNHTKPVTNHSTSYLNKETPKISEYLKFKTNKIVKAIPKLSSEGNMIMTDISQVDKIQNKTQPIKPIPLTNNQTAVSYVSQITDNSNIVTTKSQQCCTQSNTKLITIPRTGILKNGIQSETKNVTKLVSYDKILNMSHFTPQHNIVSAKLQQKPKNVVLSSLSNPNVSQITPKSNAMTLSQQVVAQKSRLINQSIANIKNKVRPNIENVTNTLTLESDAKFAVTSMSNKSFSNFVTTELEQNKTPQSNTVKKELQQNKAPQSNTAITGLQRWTPHFNTVVTSGSQQNKNHQSNTESQQNWKAQSFITTAGNIQRVPGIGHYQINESAVQNVHDLASNVQSVVPTVNNMTVVPSFSNPVIPNLMPAPGPDLILELSQNESQNGININVKRMTSEEKDLLIKR